MNTEMQIKKYKAARLNLTDCFSRQPEPLDFVLPGLKAGTVGALIGTGGVSKSMLAITEGIHVSTGLDMLGTGYIQKGHVAILSMEDDAQVLHHRLHAISGRMTAEQRSDAAKNLHIYPITHNIMSMDGVVSLALAEGCRLLVVDTLRRAHDMDENDTCEMAQVLALMERVAKQTGAAVLFVHHQGKAAITGGTASESTSARGATVLIDNTRFCMSLSNIHERECENLDIPKADRRSYIRAAWPKLSYSKPMPDIILKRGEGGVLVKATTAATVKAGARTYAQASNGGNDEKDW